MEREEVGQTKQTNTKGEAGNTVGSQCKTAVWRPVAIHTPSMPEPGSKGGKVIA